MGAVGNPATYQFPSSKWKRESIALLRETGHQTRLVLHLVLGPSTGWDVTTGLVVGEVKERVGEWFRRCPVCEVRRMCFQRLVEPLEFPAYRLMLASGRACFDTS